MNDPAVAADLAYGGKATTLAKMSIGGFRVPAGVALSSQIFLRELDRLLSTSELASAELTAIALVADTLRVPTIVVDEVERLLRQQSIDLAHLVVRSSAVGEDGATQSFAGQLDSVVDVHLDDIADAIQTVWRSAWGERAIHYRRRAGLEKARALPVGVIVQELIEPERAGVMFTTAAVRSGHDEIVIESVAGRGEHLVDGSVSPTRYTCSDGMVTLEGGDAGALPNAVMHSLMEVGADLEKLLCVSGLDVEWVYSRGELSIVQARPITTKSSASADASLFSCSAVRITKENRLDIPDAMAAKDKFRLRLLASRASVPISRGWLIECRQEDGPTIEDTAAVIASEAADEDQVSIVLQRPARFDGEIFRRFSPLASLSEQLKFVIETVGTAAEDFDLIVTEVYKAEKSGIAHLSEDRLFVEVGFGAYIPKGIVPTSLYVFASSGELVDSSAVEQETGIFIENGMPVERAVGAQATVNVEQAAAIRAMTQAVVDDYGDVSVEFGIRPSGYCYLIDIIPEGSGAVGTDIRVMSPGVVDGRAVFADSEDLLARSLDAHFHSERSVPGSTGDPRVIVAPRPFLALEEYLVDKSDGRLGFIFESGSLLGHLAIILREHRVPAIVVPGIRDMVTPGDSILIDTSSQNLFTISTADA